MTPPRIAVQKRYVHRYSRSVPGSGPSCVAAPPRPPKIPEKMSRKPPVPPLLLRAQLLRTIGESNPPKSKFAPDRRLGARPWGNPPNPRRRLAATRISLSRRWINIVRVEAELVVNLAASWIAEYVVSFGEGLKFFFGSLSSGMTSG